MYDSNDIVVEATTTTAATWLQLPYKVEEDMTLGAQRQRDDNNTLDQVNYGKNHDTTLLLVQLTPISYLVSLNTWMKIDVSSAAVKILKTDTTTYSQTSQKPSQNPSIKKRTPKLIWAAALY